MGGNEKHQRTSGLEYNSVYDLRQKRAPGHRNESLQALEIPAQLHRLCHVPAVRQDEPLPQSIAPGEETRPCTFDLSSVFVLSLLGKPLLTLIIFFAGEG